MPNESARASAYEKLQRDLLEGDFEENGRSRVLYLHPWTVKAKMTRQWMENMIETHPRATIPRQYFDHCWLPRNLFQRRLAKHHLPASPRRFQPQKSHRVTASIAGDESTAIKALASHLKDNGRRQAYKKRLRPDVNRNRRAEIIAPVFSWRLFPLRKLHYLLRHRPR